MSKTTDRPAIENDPADVASRPPPRPLRRLQFSLARLLAAVPLFGVAAIAARSAIDVGRIDGHGFATSLIASVAVWVAGTAIGVVAGGWRGAMLASSATQAALVTFWVVRSR